MLADYVDQRKAVDNLLLPGCSKRILIFKGESGFGKSALIQYCSEQARSAGILQIPLDFKDPAVSVAEIFNRSGSWIGWKNLPNFTRSVAEMQATPEIKVDKNWLLGINNKITVVLGVSTPDAKEERRSMLTEAWFEDLKAIGKTILFIFENYHEIGTEADEWVRGRFLARAAPVEHVRIVMGCQPKKVPDNNNITWGPFAETYELTGVRDPKHWLPVFEALKKRLPEDYYPTTPLFWLKLMCDANLGQPSTMMQVITRLPRADS